MRRRILTMTATSFLVFLLLCQQAGAQVQALPSPPGPEAKASPGQASSDSQLRWSAQPEPAGALPAKPAVQSGAVEQKDDAAKSSDAEKSKWNVRLGTVTVGVSYVHLPDSLFFNPFYPYGFYPYGLYPYSLAYSVFYDPFYPTFYSPYAGGFAYAEDKGKVELAVDEKTAAVYLDGAYAGQATNLKRMWLRPGAYDLTVVGREGSSFHQRIYVLSQKSLKIKARLVPPSIQGKTGEKQP